jgi:type II secretory pathway pseudopilin PulG
MKLTCSKSSLQVFQRQHRRGFSLIEMIGVFTVLALLALALTPILIKQFDRIAAEKETAQLKAIAEAFRQGIMTTKRIPDQNSWASMIATNLGLTSDQVRTNERRVARVFFADPRLELGSAGSGLEYVQTMNGSAIPPTNYTRVMILSSLSQPIPTFSTQDPILLAQYFSDLWNSQEDVPPSWLTTSWAWTGKPEDLKIQRIHLANLFVQLTLNKDANNSGLYSIDGTTPAAPPRSPFVAYFIDGTKLELFDLASQALQHGEILHTSKSFDSVLGSWRAEKFLGRTIQHPDPVDLQLAADAFFSAPQNPGRKMLPGGTDPTTTNVFNGMISYMSNYVYWSKSDPAFVYDTGAGSPYIPVQDAATFLAALTKNQVDKQ